MGNEQQDRKRTAMSHGDTETRRSAAKSEGWFLYHALKTNANQTSATADDVPISKRAFLLRALHGAEAALMRGDSRCSMVRAFSGRSWYFGVAAGGMAAQSAIFHLSVTLLECGTPYI